MKLFYLVGGPTRGHEAQFRRRLAELRGPPVGWQIYPHESRLMTDGACGLGLAGPAAPKHGAVIVV